MAKRQRTPAQIEADKARMARVRAKRQQHVTEIKEEAPVPREEPTTAPPLPEDNTVHESKAEREQMQRQIDEIMETNTLLKAALLGQMKGNDSVSIGKGNKLVGEVERYIIDPANYPDPTPRLMKEPRLMAVNFIYEYELDYKFDTVPYQTKTGINYVEPKFEITLNRIVLDDQGTQTDKRYIAKRLLFHEDPQAALVIARENNIDIDENDEKTFLNEMRYLRVRDWLFDVFWPTPAQPNSQIREEVIGGTLVQVFTKNSVEASAVDFDKLDTKV